MRIKRDPVDEPGLGLVPREKGASDPRGDGCIADSGKCSAAVRESKLLENRAEPHLIESKIRIEFSAVIHLADVTVDGDALIAASLKVCRQALFGCLAGSTQYAEAQSGVAKLPRFAGQRKSGEGDRAIRGLEFARNARIVKRGRDCLGQVRVKQKAPRLDED
jgi:hypothetical protein